jgi:hypothetical protein
LFVTLFTLNGCVIKDELPKEWGQLNKFCSGVSGLFSNIGSSTSGNSNVKLSEIIAPNANSGYLPKYIAFEVSSVINKFEIELVTDSEVLDKMTLEVDESHGCDKGGYLITRSYVTNSGGAIGREWWEYKLYFTSEALIVSKKKGIIGALFFVPIVGTQTQWIRFDKAIQNDYDLSH